MYCNWIGDCQKSVYFAYISLRIKTWTWKYHEVIQQYMWLAEKLCKRFYFFISLSRSLPLLFDYGECVCVFGFGNVCQLGLQFDSFLKIKGWICSSLWQACNYSISLHASLLYRMKSFCWWHPLWGRSVVAADLEIDLCMNFFKN